MLMILLISPTVHLLAAHRPESRWPSCTGDRAHVQDWQGSVQSVGEGLDAQVRHVARCVQPPRAHSTSPASSSCIRRLFVVDTLFIIASTLCMLMRTLVYVCLMLGGWCRLSSIIQIYCTHFTDLIVFYNILPADVRREYFPSGCWIGNWKNWIKRYSTN